eukprot:TRINITY_DN780_c0_g1_i1.p2 TRINITY_DN780_c0_g1~~TRINITY_DN780_c0_g1_i1.p2  ORF type:complete len:249 (+),score=46.66 TRINITY_DN780_c0_g1_i1:971-1717(+)
MMRSQLDCWDPNIQGRLKTFDLKTRSVRSVRTSYSNPSFVFGCPNHSKLAGVLGYTNSIESEFYDLVRTTLIKYNFQVRIGKMSGLFLLYHNTHEVFGYEYLPVEDIDQSLFYTSETASACFDVTTRAFEYLLEEIVKSSEVGENVRVTIGHNFRTNLVTAFAEYERKAPISEGHYPSESLIVNPIMKFTLSLRAVVNDRVVMNPILKTGDSFESWISLTTDHCSPLEYMQALNSAKWIPPSDVGLRL